MRVFFMKTIGLLFISVWVKTLHNRAFNHRRIVFISNNGAFRVRFVGVAYHAKQRFFLRFTV